MIMTIDLIGSLSKFGSLSLGDLKKTHPASLAAAPSENFTAVLADIAKQAASTVKAGEEAAIKGIQGQAPLQEVVQSVIRAQHALQTGLVLRDKVVSAYQDLIRMTI
jgi:flagellar hook-basal body complex protein FliE